MAHFVLSVVFLFSYVANAEEVLKREHVEVSWLAPQVFDPDKPTKVAVHFKVDPEWHIYWKNPGDSGAAPKFEWITGNVKVGAVEWPYPSRILVGDIVNFGFPEDATFPVEVRAEARKSVDIAVKLEWLVCQVACIPGFGELTLKRAVEREIWDPAKKEELDQALEKIPAPAEKSEWKISFSKRSQSSILFYLENTDKEIVPDAISLFPTNGDYILPQNPKIEKIGGRWQAEFQIRSGAQVPTSTGMVLVDHSANNSAWEWDEIVFASSGERSPFSEFLWLLITAVLGGVILNLMPCVFPVLSIKVASMVQSGTAKDHFREGLFYTAGVLVTFAALGGLFLILRQAGHAVGWGFQLQSPVIILFLILLFWLMALNFFGVFGFGDRIMAWAGSHSTNSSFGTGVLSVFVAAPCTGPFMGSALGASATLPALQAMLIFTGLGLGLALPILILTLSPRTLALLPKPGAWMERFKEFLAFPLLAAVIWLTWVLAQQVALAWVIGTSLLLLSFFSFWLAKSKNRIWRAGAFVIFFLALGFAIKEVRGEQTALAASSQVWESFSEEKVDEARKTGQAVFVDFTAAWCITCQWNKKTVLETDSIQKLFKDQNVKLFRADWTNYDPKITAALAKLGRNSIPVYLFYSSDGSEVQVLPQILTSSIIENLFNNSTLSAEEKQ